MVKRRDEAFEIDFYEKVLKRNPTQIDALRQLGHLYTRSGRIQEGLKADLLLTLLCPGDAIAQYNLACSYALAGEADKGLNCLAEAIRLGYRDIGHLKTDPDLENLRADPRFALLLGQASGSGSSKS